MSTVKEKKERKKRKYSIKDGDSETWNKKHSLALNLRP